MWGGERQDLLSHPLVRCRRPPIPSRPPRRASVTIDRGQLVVSSVVGDGFYFTDLDPLTTGIPPAFNHGFAYNYAYPAACARGMSSPR